MDGAAVLERAGLAELVRVAVALHQAARAARLEAGARHVVPHAVVVRPLDRAAGGNADGLGVELDALHRDGLRPAVTARGLLLRRGLGGAAVAVVVASAAACRDQ